MSNSYLGSGAPNAPGTKVLISTQTASASSTVAFTSFRSSTYQYYEILITTLDISNDNVQLYLEFSDDNGVSWLNSGYNWVRRFTANTVGGAGGVAVGTSNTQISLSNSVGAGANEGVAGVLLKFIPSSNTANLPDFIQWQTTNIDFNSLLVDFVGSGLIPGSAAINGLRFRMSAGTITTGKFYLYGIVA